MHIYVRAQGYEYFQSSRLFTTLPLFSGVVCLTREVDTLCDALTKRTTRFEKLKRNKRGLYNSVQLLDYVLSVCDGS